VPNESCPSLKDDPPVHHGQERADIFYFFGRELKDAPGEPHQIIQGAGLNLPITVLLELGKGGFASVRQQDVRPALAVVRQAILIILVVEVVVHPQNGILETTSQSGPKTSRAPASRGVVQTKLSSQGSYLLRRIQMSPESRTGGACNGCMKAFKPNLVKR
jgi:hypothetical protein